MEVEPEHSARRKRCTVAVQHRNNQVLTENYIRKGKKKKDKRVSDEEFFLLHLMVSCPPKTSNVNCLKHQIEFCDGIIRPSDSGYGNSSSSVLKI